jgi:2'-5' RNA ligase
MTNSQRLQTIHLCKTLNYKEYLIIISPPDCVKNYIKECKNLSRRMIGDFDAMDATAHITIRLTEPKRPGEIVPFIDYLESFLAQMPPINLNINNFDFFDSSKTIYAKFELDDYTKQWMDVLKYFVGVKNLEPHITIGKTLSNKAFDKLWSHYENEKYTQSFIVNYLTILERDMIFGDYHQYKKIYFGGNDIKLNPIRNLFD